jgi:hypothetical protein
VKIRGVLVILRGNMLSIVEVTKLDGYGGPVEDGPSGRSKTVMGGFLSVVFYGVVIVLIIFNILFIWFMYVLTY